MFTCVANVSSTGKPVGRKLANPRNVSTVCSTPTVPLSCPALDRSSTSSRWISNEYCPKKGSRFSNATTPGEASISLNLPSMNEPAFVGKGRSHTGSRSSSKSLSQTMVSSVRGISHTEANGWPQPTICH
eukprot:3642214-Rhodomonas_salina.2